MPIGEVWACPESTAPLDCSQFIKARQFRPAQAKYPIRRCARESLVRRARGQTMTEYALILAAIAVVVYGTYRALGNNIGSLANGVDSTLTNA
jgi:Flp pilus assembly pilin Flp